eukprot:COSAG01_NODE_3133_length_6533_cov_117.587842_9_plen_165_part_00
MAPALSKWSEGSSFVSWAAGSFCQLSGTTIWLTPPSWRSSSPSTSVSESRTSGLRQTSSLCISTTADCTISAGTCANCRNMRMYRKSGGMVGISLVIRVWSHRVRQLRHEAPHMLKYVGKVVDSVLRQVAEPLHVDKFRSPHAAKQARRPDRYLSAIKTRTEEG